MRVSDASRAVWCGRSRAVGAATVLGIEEHCARGRYARARQRARGAEGTLPCNERGPKEDFVSSLFASALVNRAAAAWLGARWAQ